MTSNPSPDEAAQAAQQLLNDRVDAVRDLARARQQRNDARAQLDEAERADAASYAAAERAGWTPDDLRKVGFDTPGKRAPGRPRRARGRATTSSDTDTGGGSAPAAQS